MILGLFLQEVISNSRPQFDAKYHIWTIFDQLLRMQYSIYLILLQITACLKRPYINSFIRSKMVYFLFLTMRTHLYVKSSHISSKFYYTYKTHVRHRGLEYQNYKKGVFLRAEEYNNLKLPFLRDFCSFVFIISIWYEKSDKLHLHERRVKWANVFLRIEYRF